MKKYRKILIGLFALLFVVIVIVFSGSNLNKNKYTNETYGFSLSYSKDWKEVKGTGLGGEVVTLMKNDSSKEISFAYENSLEETSLSSSLNKRQNLRAALNDDLENIEEVVIGGEKGYKGNHYNSTANYPKDYYVEHNGHIYSFSYDHSLEQDQEVKQIIESFTFLP